MLLLTSNIHNTFYVYFSPLTYSVHEKAANDKDVRVWEGSDTVRSVRLLACARHPCRFSFSYVV